MVKSNLLLAAVLSIAMCLFTATNFAGSLFQSDEIHCEQKIDENIGKEQKFFGHWKITDQMPCEISVPSEYSGFDENGEIRSRDLTENLLGQSVIISKDYIQFCNTNYNLAENYNTGVIYIDDENTVIGCTTAKTLDITGDYVTVVSFELDGKKAEGERGITSINRFYIKDKDTIYASADGCLTFKLVRFEKD